MGFNNARWNDKSLNDLTEKDSLNFVPTSGWREAFDFSSE